MCSLFFFKQKTAYELRISDWSSDVCSSDLCCRMAAATLSATASAWPTPTSSWWPTGQAIPASTLSAGRTSPPTSSASPPARRCRRSEEHTSELQSLMRISYAVFCLKKKKKNKKHKKQTQTDNRTIQV